jgi:fibronectin type 3 domain-containing protein
MKMKNLVNSIIASSIIAVLASACGVDIVGREVINTEPAVPNGVTATQGTLEESVTVTWEGANNAEYYVLYKAVDTPDSFRVINTRVLGLSFSDTPAASGREFYYKVAAGNGTMWSAPSTEARGFALKGVPAPPASVTISANVIGQIELSWDTVINATGYNVYRCDVKYGTYEKINPDPITDLAYSDTDVSPDDAYYYKVVAINNHGEGAATVAGGGVALQQVPVWGTVNLAASDNVFGDQILVSWDAAAHAASYRVYRSDSELGIYVLIAENVTGLTFNDRDIAIANLTPYYYKVAAVSSGGTADSGVVDSGSLDQTIPAVLAPPTGVGATMTLINKITVSWHEVAGAHGYRVYRSANSDFSGAMEVANNVAGLSYDDTGMSPLPDQKQYYYKVTTLSIGATGTISESGVSALATGNAIPAAPLVPVSIISTMNYSAGTLTVSWQAADTCTKTYDVYRSEDGINGTYNIFSTNQAGTSFMDELTGQNSGTIEAGVEYHYKIRARNSTGVSALSGGTLSTFTLNVPANLSVSTKYNWDGGCTYNYTITWSTVKGATGYEVGIYHDGAWDVQTVSGGSTGTLIWKSDNYGGSGYNVRIRAKNATPDPDKYSAWSTEVN